MLAESITRYLASRQLPVALALGSTEVSDPGYQRQRPRWVPDGSRMHADMTFGPFVESVEFDRALLVDGDSAEVVAFEEPVRINAGMTFQYRATVRTTV